MRGPSGGPISSMRATVLRASSRKPAPGLRGSSSSTMGLPLSPPIRTSGLRGNSDVRIGGDSGKPIVVTTPSDVSLEDARKAVHMFHQVRVPILGIVENMSYLICPHCSERIDVFSHG